MDQKGLCKTTQNLYYSQCLSLGWQEGSRRRNNKLERKARREGFRHYGVKDGTVRSKKGSAIYGQLGCGGSEGMRAQGVGKTQGLRPVITEKTRIGNAKGHS